MLLKLRQRRVAVADPTLARKGALVKDPTINVAVTSTRIRDSPTFPMAVVIEVVLSREVSSTITKGIVHFFVPSSRVFLPVGVVSNSLRPTGRKCRWTPGS